MKILFITATRIGDAVLSGGLLAHLVRQYPEARFTIAAGSAAISLFAAVPGLERLIPIRKRGYGYHWFDLWRSCVGHRWDMVIDLRRSLIGWTLRTRERFVVPPPNDHLHRVELIAATLGLGDYPPAPTIWTTAQHEAEAKVLIPETGSVLAFAPAANWRGKQWRGERFAELARRLTAADGILPGARVAVFAAPEEADQAAAVLQAVPESHCIDMVGQAPLPVIGACLRRCAIFVGNDSGLMHLAAACGVPTLGLFGPSREVCYAPWGRYTATVRTAESYEELVSAPGYDHRTTDTLMDGLSVDKAEAAARELWAKVPGSPARQKTAAS